MTTTKTVTLRLPLEVYGKFKKWADLDNRPISNLISTAAMRHLEEDGLVEPAEMEEIKSDRDLMRRLKRGSKDARARRGRLIG